jgi:hypothetical protein
VYNNTLIHRQATAGLRAANSNAIVLPLQAADRAAPFLTLKTWSLRQATQ